MQIWNREVFIRRSEWYRYGLIAPFNPDKHYPELAIYGRDIDSNNTIYGGIRNLFKDAGFDAANYGKPNWNPLKKLIQPGMTVLLKPNLVRHFNDLEDDTLGTITHGSIIRSITDYVYLALKGVGRIIIADSPQDDADFEAIKSLVGLNSIANYYIDKFKFNVEYYDLRQYETRKIDGIVLRKIKLSGDPRGYNIVDLGDRSIHAEIETYSNRFYGADFDVKELRTHHRPDVHRYCIAQTVLDSDIIINLPKLKTHKKSGITLSMKNLVGINGNKNYLPHHTLGLPMFGGDQFATNSIMNLIEQYLLSVYKLFFKRSAKLSQIIGIQLKTAGKKAFGDTESGRIRSGNWHGNQTIWRTILDLNRILLFCDKDGRMTDTQQRAYMSIIDGVVCGEGNGPLACTNKFAGFIIMGQNPLDTDIVASYCMKFVPCRIPLLKQGMDRNLLRLPADTDSGPRCVFNGKLVTSDELLTKYGVRFRPHFGWRGIECEHPKKES